MKYNIKQSSLLMLFALFLVAFCFIACDDQDNEEQEQVGQLTPEALYQTSWRGTGHCAAWSLKDRRYRYTIRRYPKRKSGLGRL